MPETLTLRQLNRATLARQMLLAREPVRAVAAIERLAGMQAQEARPPFIGLWSRVADFARDDLHNALHDRAVVRATAMRATLHLVSAGDYLTLRPAMQPALTQAMGVLGARADGLDLDALIPVARSLIAERALTFTELRGLLVERFPEVNERALGYAVRLHLPLVMVPTDAIWAFPSTASFTGAETWLGAELSDDGSPEALVLRYLAAFGPAGAADVQTWSGLRRMAPVLAGLRPQLRGFTDPAGRELLDLPDAPRPAGDVPAPARFLPEFDNLVLAHADRTRIIADAHRPALVTKNLRVRATFLWDGFVAGTWDIERRRKAATLHIRSFAKLAKAAAAELEAEGGRLLAFAEPEATDLAVEFAPAGLT